MSPCSSGAAATDDAEAFHAMLRPADTNMTVTSSGWFEASHTRIDLHRVKMQVAEESLPRVWEGDLNPERHAILFLEEPGPSMFANGAEVGPDETVLYNSSNPMFCHRLTGPTRWGSMSLPNQDWEEIGIALVGNDLTPPLRLPKVIASGRALGRLRRLHASAVHLATQVPELIANPDAARSLKAEMVQALADSLIEPCTEKNTVARSQHATIMRRFRRVLEENVGQPLYLPEVCSAIGTSGRTLRLCCHENFGMGPKRYLHLRRLHLARRALQDLTSRDRSVTNIATQFGFWELGRFSIDYKSLFGESPSATLRQAPRLH